MATAYLKRGKRHIHRTVAERLIGRPLRSGEIVHHIDGDSRNNDPSNLKVMTQAEHARLHSTGAKRKPRMVCKNGHPLTPSNIRITSIGRRRCLICERVYSKDWHRKKRHARGLRKPGPKPASVARRTRNHNGRFAKDTP